MPDNAETDEMGSTVCPRGPGKDDLDLSRRRRTEYCDARQLLSETLRLRRAAQLQRANAGDAGSQLTLPTAAVSVLRRFAVDDTVTKTFAGPKRRKKPRHDRGSAMDKPQPRARRIMFHEYRGPPDDGLEIMTTSGPLTSAQLVSSTSGYFTSPTMMTTTFSPNIVASSWKFCSDDEHHNGTFQASSSSTLPRFSELQRSLRSSSQHQYVVDRLPLTHGIHLEPVGGSSSPAVPVCQPSSLAAALSCRSTTASALTSDQLVPSAASAALSTSPLSSVALSTHLQRFDPQSVTSSINVASGLFTPDGVDHVTTCFPSVTAAYRPNTGKKSPEMLNIRSVFSRPY